ncbi:hypothetical protein FY112_29815 [Rhizobium sp. PEPV16]|nr:hypothetical protein FY112_29815 [Rhizobium sp. PEPV16]
MPAFLIAAAHNAPILVSGIGAGLQIASFSISFFRLFIAVQIRRCVEGLVGIGGFLAFFDDAKLLFMRLLPRHDILLSLQVYVLGCG